MYFQKILPYILCCRFCLSLAAQTSTIDSLEHVLASGKLNPLERYQALLDISREYEYIDTAKSIAFVREALILAQNNGLKKEEANAYIALSYRYYNTDTAKNRTYAMEALSVAQSTGLEDVQASAYKVLGNYYLSIDQYYLSHVNYKAAEKLLLKINDRKELQNVYHNLMILFYLIGDDENTIYYGNKALELMTGQGTMMPNEFTVQYILGFARFRNNREQEALDFFLDMYQKAKLLNIDKMNTGNITMFIAQTYMNQERYREALPYLYATREYFEAGHLFISNVYSWIATTYVMLHQVDSAEYYLAKVLNTPFIDDDAKLTLLYSRSEVESAKEDYRSALEIYRKYHHLSDSIAKAKKTTEMARVRNWHELEQKDNENMMLQEEHQKKRWLITVLAITMILILALLVLSVFFYRQNREKNRKLKELHTVKDKLFSVIAHDLRSPVSSLTSMLELANNNMLDAETQAQLFRDISMRVDDTHSLLDNLLRWSKSQMKGIAPLPTYFDVQNEMQTLMVNLQNIATAKQITLNNRIGNQEVYADRDMFAVVVRNLITNAIKYTSAEGEVTLSSELSDNMLVISVKDTGTGMSQEIQDSLFKLPKTRSQRGTRNESGAGLGLVLCSDFVKANGGSIWFTSMQGEGSTFSFSVPVKGN